MIDQALQLVADRLNAHLSAAFSVPEDLVALSPLTDAEGKPATETRNRLALFLINIAQDKMPRNTGPRGSSGVGTAKPIHLDIYFMLASGHDANIYGEGLKLISSALMFIQSHPVLTPQNTPEMPQGIEQLALEIANLRVEEVGQLWGNLGGRYVPSMMFKMRSVVIDSGAITDVTPLVRGATAQTERADAL